MCLSWCNENLVFVFQAVLVLSSPYAYVNAENVTRLAKKWPKFHPLWPEERSEYRPPNLRQGEEDVPRGGENAAAPAGDANRPKQGSFAERYAFRFTHAPTTIFRRKRTTALHVSAEEQCDYIALNCLRAFQTGRVCARTVYNYYFTFKNYCMMLYTNCKERYEAWQAIHMGDCLRLKPQTEVFVEPDWDSGIMNGYYAVYRELV